MTPEFDPAVVQVLGTFRRLLDGSPDDGLDADAVIGALMESDERIGTALSADRPRMWSILESLARDGLLEPTSGEPVSPATRYRLTSLGRARLGRTDAED